MKNQSVRLCLSWGLYRWLFRVLPGDVTEWFTEHEAARVDRATAARIWWQFRRAGGCHLRIIK